jgi:hypothetical protein
LQRCCNQEARHEITCCCLYLLVLNFPILVRSKSCAWTNTFTQTEPIAGGD